MRKILTPDSWTFDEPQSHILPVRSGKVPLGSNDRRILSMAKIADEQLLSKIASLRKSPGEELVHMLAVGCTEMYGPNRNGDGFRAAVCEQYHPTFVKYARFYRNHKSDNPAASYGLVKLSHYNRTMGRIELIAALNANEEAARLNGGMLADLEMQKLASGDDIPVSMGCMVPFDICSYCGNKAPTRKHYCDERMCKAGGLKRNMGRTLESGDVLHADNTEPAYNDISHIVGGRQADRIAFVTGALQKMAQDTGFIAGGAELAELYYADEGEPNYWQKRASELAALDNMEHKALQAGLPKTPISLPEFPLVKLSQLTAALADNGVILSISDFARVLVNGAPVREDLLKQACSGMFSRLRCPDINPYDHRGPIDSRYSTWAAHTSRTHSLKVASLQKRAAQAELSGREATGSGLATLLKYASVSPNVEALVQQYGLYVLAAVDRLSDNSDFRLTPTAAILQNRIH